MRILFPLLAPILLIPHLSLAADAPKPLPLRDVALFSSGVGYFGRAGIIDGETDVPLLAHAPQISDLLKSLVLFDPKGGVRPVTYSLQDYLPQRSRETDLNLGAAASPGALLQSFQGARVRLEKPTGPIEGLILSVSSTSAVVKEIALTIEQVSLWNPSGVQTVRLDEVTGFQLLDPDLDLKLHATLEKKARALTQKLDEGARSVSLHFAGGGRREVRAAYLLETPAWKTSYRLVLDDKKKPYLQGWAVVENTTDEDWKGVRLSLVSGRPISFIQDLATPVYVARPIVAPQIIGSARPQTFGEGFSPNSERLTALEALPADRLAALEARPTPLENRVTPPPRLGIKPSILHQTGSASYIDNARGGRTFLNSNNLASGLKADGAQSQAQGAERGELFEYAIEGATTLARGEAAMVPIVSGDIGGEAVSIVDSSLQRGEIPTSNGFLLRNSSGLHLQGGPITVFASDTYAGDALISNLGPNDNRLIAYARDLELLATQNEPQQDNAITKLTVIDGVLHIKRSASKTRTWNFKNKGTAAKNVLLQVPDEGGWKLASPKQLTEKTAEGQRFRFVAPPGDSQSALKWTTQSEETTIIFDAAPDELTALISQDAISPTLKARLTDVIAQKARLSNFASQRALQEASLKDIEADQARIRANMEPLDKSSKLFKSYEAKLGAQENRIERVREEITRLREAENSARANLKNSLATLNLD